MRAFLIKETLEECPPEKLRELRGDHYNLKGRFFSIHYLLLHIQNQYPYNNLE